MARGTKDEIQDRILSGFDKVNRNSKRDNSQTQDEKDAAFAKMTPAERRKNGKFSDYVKDLVEFIYQREKRMPRHINEEVFSRKIKPGVEKFHSEGTDFATVHNWIKTQR